MQTSVMLNSMTKPLPPQRYTAMKNSTEDDQMIYKNIPVYLSLHEAMKDAAKKNGISMYEAYEVACRLYLQTNTYFVPEIGEVTADEKSWIEEALALYRNRNSNRVYGEVVSAVKSMIRVARRTKI
jgi:hypothetical protein